MSITTSHSKAGRFLAINFTNRLQKLAFCEYWNSTLNDSYPQIFVLNQDNENQLLIKQSENADDVGAYVSVTNHWVINFGNESVCSSFSQLLQLDSAIKNKQNVEKQVSILVLNDSFLQKQSETKSTVKFPSSYTEQRLIERIKAHEGLQYSSLGRFGQFLFIALSFCTLGTFALGYLLYRSIKNRSLKEGAYFKNKNDTQIIENIPLITMQERVQIQQTDFSKQSAEMRLKISQEEDADRQKVHISRQKTLVSQTTKEEKQQREDLVNLHLKSIEMLQTRYSQFIQLSKQQNHERNKWASHEKALRTKVETDANAEIDKLKDSYSKLVAMTTQQTSNRVQLFQQEQLKRALIVGENDRDRDNFIKDSASSIVRIKALEAQRAEKIRKEAVLQSVSLRNELRIPTSCFSTDKEENKWYSYGNELNPLVNEFHQEFLVLNIQMMHHGFNSETQEEFLEKYIPKILEILGNIIANAYPSVNTNHVYNETLLNEIALLKEIKPRESGLPQLTKLLHDMVFDTNGSPFPWITNSNAKNNHLTTIQYTLEVINEIMKNFRKGPPINYNYSPLFHTEKSHVSEAIATQPDYALIARRWREQQKREAELQRRHYEELRRQEEATRRAKELLEEQRNPQLAYRARPAYSR